MFTTGLEHYGQLITMFNCIYQVVGTKEKRCQQDNSWHEYIHTAKNKETKLQTYLINHISPECTTYVFSNAWDK